MYRKDTEPLYHAFMHSPINVTHINAYNLRWVVKPVEGLKNSKNILNPFKQTYLEILMYCDFR